MDVFHVYCFKSVDIYKQKLYRIESLVILYWVLDCRDTYNIQFFLNHFGLCIVEQAGLRISW